jgi:hypothetical protein
LKRRRLAFTNLPERESSSDSDDLGDSPSDYDPSEEQPIAVAFCDGFHDAHHELVYSGDFFWGTVFGVDTDTAQAMTATNNQLLENSLAAYFPTQPIMLIVAAYCHFHF